MKATTTVLCAVVLLATVLGPSPCLAATWTVEKDGSGDFTIIQAALDAASPGDTILIGPGRYDTFHTNTRLQDGFPDAAIAWVRTTNLTIIGAGSRETIIGPSSSVTVFDGIYTSCLIVDAVGFAEVRDIGLENSKWEFNAWAQVLMEDCRIERTDGARSRDFSAYFGFSDGSIVRRCEMINTGGIVTMSGVTGLLIEDCYFEEQDDYDGSAIHFVSGAQDCVIRRCEVVGGGAGIQVGGRTLVEDCEVSGVRVVGLENLGGGPMIIRRCQVGETRMALMVRDGIVELYDSVLEGGTQGTIFSSGDIHARGNHILNGGATTVDSNARAAQGELIDLRFNWWGTSDPAQIQSWIVEYEAGSVLWNPFNDMPISAEAESISRLKGKFSDQ